MSIWGCLLLHCFGRGREAVFGGGCLVEMGLNCEELERSKPF